MEVDYSWENRIEFDWLISSMGGVGSTALMKYLENVAKINPTGFHTGCSRFKHARWPDPFWNVKGAIFVYGDPRDATISLFNRVLVHTHLTNMAVPKRKLIVPDEVQAGPGFDGIPANIQRYMDLNEDVFQFEEMIKNWATQLTPYPRMLVKHEKLYDNPEAVLDFLKCNVGIFRESFPKKKTRSSNWSEHPCAGQLSNLFSGLIEKIDTIPDVLVIPSNEKMDW
tara:strand:- start:5290 stop:5964 length:675 start_codon:yes stop_codon:yes gene_type:complete